LAKRVHPDAGGTNEKMRELNASSDLLLQIIKSLEKQVA
jgi:hypothetical protein